MTCLEGQTVFRNSDGDLFIQLPDGTEREVVPSDSILFRSAFEEIEDRKLEVKSADEIEHFGDYRKREGIDFSSIKLRLLSNQIQEAKLRLEELEEEKIALEEELEYARQNPGRIRPSDRVEMSDRYSEVNRLIRNFQNKIVNTENLLVHLKRYGHAEILSQMPLPEIKEIDRDYNFGALKGENQIAKGLETSAEDTAPRWKSPDDLPMPILPHPSSVHIDNLLENPPEPECRISDFSDSPFTDAVHFQTEREELFYHIPHEMRIHLRGKPMLTCEVNISRRGPAKFLNFHFTLHIPSARRTFGGLAKNTPIRLLLLNGDIVNLTNLHPDTGNYHKNSNTVTFSAITPLTRRDESKLKGSELDQIRVVWDRGFEDYDIQNIFLIIDHLQCLERHTAKN